MNFEFDIEALKQAVLEKLVDELREALLPELEEVTLLTINRAAGMCDLSVSQLNRAMTEWVDLGEQSKRISVAQLRRLIEKRTVKRR